MSGAFVVIGGSAGGIEALESIFRQLPGDFAAPILIVEHLHPSDDGALARHLAHLTRLRVLEPNDKTLIEARHVYTAPANYHMLVERPGSISLSVDDRVNWSRPSIDVLFESAAHAWGPALVAVILSGANADGAKGLKAVKVAGGHTIAQDPHDATSPQMPQAAINTGAVDEVLRADSIAQRLVTLCQCHATRKKP